MPKAERFNDMPAQIFYDKDADLSLIQAEEGDAARR